MKRILSSAFILCECTLTAGIDVPKQINADCPTMGEANACGGDCESGNVACIIACEGDNHCIAECTRGFADCMDWCPCYDKCFDGCPCEHDSVYCGNCQVDYLDEYAVCSDEAHETLYSCLNACPNFDIACDHKCTIDFDKQLKNCPCMENCPGGCPCSDYECPSKVAEQFVVMRSNGQPEQRKVRLDLSPPPTDIGVDWFDVDLKNSHEPRIGGCSMVLRNRVYIIGGRTHDETQHRQLMVNIENQAMVTLTDLAMNLNHPICATTDGNHGMVCQGSHNCWTILADKKENDLQLTRVANVSENHVYGRMCHKKHEPLIIWGLEGNGVTELYDAESNQWNVIANNPEMAGYEHFSVVYLHSSTMVFGGVQNEVESRDVYRLNLKNGVYTWKVYDEKLLEPRQHHTTIKHGNTIIHIGGIGNKPYEVWEEDPDTQNKWTIRRTSDKLGGWAFWPVAFFVEPDQFNTKP